MRSGQLRAASRLNGGKCGRRVALARDAHELSPSACTARCKDRDFARLFQFAQRSGAGSTVLRARLSTLLFRLSESSPRNVWKDLVALCEESKLMSAAYGSFSYPRICERIFCGLFALGGFDKQGRFVCRLHMLKTWVPPIYYETRYSGP